MYRLLIADDEQLEREAIKFIIEESFPGSFTICEAANGLEVVEIALAFKPDLLFLDIKMPGINGLQAAAQINRVLPECRIIIVTAFHYFNYAKEALSLGVVDYITKPAPPEAVVETVKRLIVELESASFKERLAAEREQQLQQITGYFEDDLLVLIAYGEIEAKEIEDYFAILNLQAQTFFAAVATILYPNTPGASILEIEKRVLNKNVVGWVKEYMQKVGRQAYIRSIGAEVFILLLAEENLDEYQARLTGMRLFTELKEALWKEQQIALNIGIGGLCNETGQIGQAFSQAKYALRYEAAPDSIISYGDIERDQQQVFYPYHREKRLYQSILQGDIHASQQLLEDLLTWLREHTSCLEAFQQKVYVGAPRQLTLQIIDCAGSKQMVGPAVDAFAAQNPNIKIDYIIGTSPELPSKIKAQQMAGNVETNVVLTGYDAMGSGLVQQIWERIMPEQKKSFPNLEDNYLPAAKAAFDLFDGYGIVFAWCPGGPMFTYNPDRVKNVPRTTDELLAWCKANPGKFMYPRP
ncbi:MAG TPA: hypothetical protein DD789_09890, partial [Firmicutes bacterium]|nr:hypothetical protein [Bacillota bacterium]